MIVYAVYGCFVVLREKINVKYWMDTPLHWKLKVVVDRRHHLDYPKGAMAFGS